MSTCGRHFASENNFNVLIFDWIFTALRRKVLRRCFVISNVSNVVLSSLHSLGDISEVTDCRSDWAVNQNVSENLAAKFIVEESSFLYEWHSLLIIVRQLSKFNILINRSLQIAFLSIHTSGDSFVYSQSHWISISSQNIYVVPSRASKMRSIEAIILSKWIQSVVWDICQCFFYPPRGDSFRSSHL